MKCSLFLFFLVGYSLWGGGDFGSGSGSKLNCAARVGSGQTISGTGRVRASVLSPCRPLRGGRGPRLRGVGELGRGQAPLLRGGRGPRLRGVGELSGVQAQRPPSLCQRAPPPFLLDSSLHSTHLCTYSSLSAVPNVWTIYAPQPRPSACRDYIYQHSHVHVCISLCLLSDRLHSVSCTRDTSTTLPSGVSRS